MIGHMTLCGGADPPTLFPGSCVPPGAEVSPLEGLSSHGPGGHQETCWEQGVRSA